jgi:glycerol-3-phosphate acyltransferase PlsY
MDARALAVALAAGYLLGSIPSSLLVVRRLRGIDIREHGSGNAGAANVLRVLGWRPALAVLVADTAKGWLAVRLAQRGVESTALAAGLAAVAGHVFPVFAGLRGGKGVATGAGAMLALQPLALGVAAAIFGATLWLSRRVAVGSMVAAASLPLALVALRAAGLAPASNALVAFGGVLALAVVATHRSNLRNLIRGTEPTLGSAGDAPLDQSSPGSSLR